MLHSRDVFEAAHQAILAVDQDRAERKDNTSATGSARGRYYTLEGAVAECLFRQLDRPLDRVLENQIDLARSEEIQMRLGAPDPRDLPDYDPETPEVEPLSKAEKLERSLRRALEELAELRTHTCTYDQQDYCTVCGLNGRA